MNGSFVLIDILHHQYSARPSCTAVVETAELMNRYLAVADAFKNGFQIEVFLVNSHLSDGTCLVSRLAPFHHHLCGCLPLEVETRQAEITDIHQVHDYFLPCEPSFCRLGYPDQGEHDGYFSEHADGSGERRATLQSEEADGYSHCQFEEVGGSNHSCGSCDVVRQMPGSGPSVSYGKDEIGL